MHGVFTFPGTKSNDTLSYITMLFISLPSPFSCHNQDSTASRVYICLWQNLITDCCVRAGNVGGGGALPEPASNRESLGITERTRAREKLLLEPFTLTLELSDSEKVVISLY